MRRRRPRTAERCARDRQHAHQPRPPRRSCSPDGVKRPRLHGPHRTIRSQLIIRCHTPEVAGRFTHKLQAERRLESREAPPHLLPPAAHLQTHGFQTPTLTTAAFDEGMLEVHFADLDTASRATLLSQAGPHAARVFTEQPTFAEFPVHPFALARSTRATRAQHLVRLPREHFAQAGCRL